MKTFWDYFLIYGTAAIFLLSLATVMLASDSYYSRMEREYPILTRLDSLDGVITDFVVHHKHTYIQVDSTVQRLIVPTKNEQYEPEYFHKLINLGVSIVKKENSKDILLIADGKSYVFEINEDHYRR
ncbi:MAG: hypothetical protein ACFB15_14290 [Cyclobacteriaceae bacterium]